MLYVRMCKATCNSSLVLGFGGYIFVAFFGFIVKPSPVFKGGAAGGRLGREVGQRHPALPLFWNELK